MIIFLPMYFLVKFVPGSIIDRKRTKRDSKMNKNDRAKMELAGFDPETFRFQDGRRIHSATTPIE